MSSNDDKQNLSSLSIAQARQQLSDKKITSVELVESCLKVIEAKNPSLNAYLEVFSDAKEQAKEADSRREKGEKGSLLGIPLAIKDNILIEGRHASAGSKMLEGYTATYDATAIKKLKDSGAVFLGRTNMDEFALGGSTEHSAFGPSKNPLDESRVPGGTSGGSAAAVAAHMALGALGSDTGGSIRQPASFCGIVGLKPTYGAVSRSGLIAAVSSFDQIGPLTKTVEDAELLFNALRGQDPLDSTTIGDDAYRERKKEVSRIGIPTQLLVGALEEDVRDAFSASLKTLEEKGIRMHYSADLPSADLALASYYIVNFAEVSANLARFDGVRYGRAATGDSLFDDYAKTRGEGFGKEVRRRIMLGTYVLSSGYFDAYYGKASAFRARLSQEFEALWKDVEVIALPTVPFPAFKLGEKADPLSLYLADIFTVPANLAGLPALSVPCGTVTRDGKTLPVGVQFIAPKGGERLLFSIGKMLRKEGVQ